VPRLFRDDPGRAGAPEQYRQGLIARCHFPTHNPTGALTMAKKKAKKKAAKKKK
jgi:hypothetical protein